MNVIIPGQPVGKGRPRFARVGKFVRTYTPNKTAAWESGAIALMKAAHIGPPTDGPVRVRVNAVGKRPRRLLRIKDPSCRMWRTSKPDGDNVLKAVCDAMVKAGVIVDDVQVVDQRVLSQYAAKGEGPRVEVVWERVGYLYSGLDS